MTLIYFFQISLKPPRLPFEQAAGVYVNYLTAYDAIFAKTVAAGSRNPVGKSHSVLVIGASGGVGLAALQLAKRGADAALVRLKP